MPHEPDSRVVGAMASVIAGDTSVFGALRTVRSRRVGAGYLIDSGAGDEHPVTRRPQVQRPGPHRFRSAYHAPLEEWEIALLAWAACGPNGMVAWDVPMDGGFNQIASVRGRTAPGPNNTLAADLIVIDDSGSWLYRPEPELGDVQAIASDPREHALQVLAWYREGRIRLLEGRPEIDWAMRDPAAPHSPLNGPHQFNMNRPGSAWLLPVTDAAALGSGLVDLYATRKAYIVDDLSDGRPAGNEDLVSDGRVQRPVALTSYEQGLLTNESFPIGCMVQNVRLAAEAMGLGTWCFSGHDADLLLGAKPRLSPGLGFEAAAPNPRTPIAAGRHKIFGIRDVKEATFVPSPRFATAKALVTEWYEQRHGPGAWAYRGPANPIAAERTPWRPENAQAIAEHPDAEPPSWAWHAAERHISYCVDRYGQWPVTFNPMQAGFGVTVHHVDTDFYDRHYRPGLVTLAIREHHALAHGGQASEAPLPSADVQGPSD